MQSEDGRVLAALAKARPAIARAARGFRDCYLAGGNVRLFGAGTSGRLAVVEAAELPPTFGTDPRRVRAIVAGGRAAVFRAKEGAEDRAREGARGARGLGPRDLAIGVSASSVTPFVRGALEAARRRGARTISLTSSRRPGLSRIADLAIVLEVGPEVLAGSTRLKAGTATKLALNQITTSALASAGQGVRPMDGGPARRLGEAEGPRRPHRGGGRRLPAGARPRAPRTGGRERQGGDRHGAGRRFRRWRRADGSRPRAETSGRRSTVAAVLDAVDYI